MPLLFFGRTRVNGKREFKAVGYYCNNCKWFLTDGAFNRGPRVPTQKEQLQAISLSLEKWRRLNLNFSQNI